MLFMDGEVSSLEYLAKQDSRLLDVASVEDIDVTVKIALAEEEIATDVESMMNGLKWMDQPFWCRPRPTIDNVVVTAAMKLWHAYRTLEMVYEDAFFSQLNDRFRARRDQFHERARAAREKVIGAGVAIVWHPVPQAEAPTVEPAPGAGLPDGTYYAAVTWVNEQGEEGACSAAVSIASAGGLFLVKPGDAPRGVTGWNVYAGTAVGALWLQNAEPVELDQPWIQMSAPGTGRAPGDGQTPDEVLAVPRVLRRG
jgi:hypothetical protein